MNLSDNRVHLPSDQKRVEAASADHSRVLLGNGHAGGLPGAVAAQQYGGTNGEHTPDGNVCNHLGLVQRVAVATEAKDSCQSDGDSQQSVATVLSGAT